MLRLKNEARWIRAVLESAFAVCERIYVLDDHSTDHTADICQSFGERLRLYSSGFASLDEARDKNWLLDLVQLSGAEWVLAIDGDEVLGKPEAVLASVASGAADSYALRVLYLWDRPDQVRADGVYGRFWRGSLFRLRDGATFQSTPNGGNFHCGNVPQGLGQSARSEAFLLHYGYLDARDRRRKFEWYNQYDPGNQAEDSYRHMIQGDPGGPAAELQLRHAGPLVLAPLEPAAGSATAEKGLLAFGS